MTSKEIRKTFTDFFASKGHRIVASAPMVVKNDPTLMFTNAGMNQFKDIFLGNAAPEAIRVADSQKCLRVSGKHNDLEEVGHDTYHHTMFEMLGNWSFGDYFKEEAIAWAWELLTQVYGLPKERLYATVFEGYEKDGLSMDKEAYDIWKKYLPESHIIKGNKHDNFWEMGDTGPCGPCSEIHMDLRSDAERAQISGAEMVNKGHHLVIEIWNLVFMQYNRKANGSLEQLPAKHVDTGMGFERLCMALQGKQSNYDTDVFSGMINEISRLSGVKYEPDTQIGVAMRVIADHIRAICFSITDGQLPGNVKAGYVIRRILRRAVRYGYTFLGFREPFLCRLVPQLVKDMGEAFPEIAQQESLVSRVVKEEEDTFLRTLERGIKFISDYMAAHKDDADKIILGVNAFTLYDTYGFPIDLTQLIAKEHGYQVDMEGFNVELQKQKERARNATAIENGDWVEILPFSSCEYVGYDTDSCLGRLMKYRTVKAKGKEMLQMVFDRTPFYGEMGGEVGDTGTIRSSDGEKIRIINTIKENNLTIHIAEHLPSNFESNFILEVDTPRKRRIAANHTCTHLLHQALREILGSHVEQKGSFVCDSYFRFDFSHFEKLSAEQIRKVESRVNELIRENNPLVEKRDATMEEARSQGAMALFGEKYGDRVRIVRFGESVELCGGCHAGATGEVGIFRIKAESAVAAGIRRIEAVTGIAAEALINDAEDTLRSAKALLGNAQDVTGAISRLLEENEKLKKQMEEVEKERTIALKKELLSAAEERSGRRIVTVGGGKFEGTDPALLRNAAFALQKETENFIIASAISVEGKPQLLLMYSADLVAAGKNAQSDIKEAAKLIQGGGGGQGGLATAGGRNEAGLSAALALLVELSLK
ncbi:MAG: alanine--tRNA ligase [Bacteroidales bacterium]|nr:alanine--tRNA ligase [Candidatus Cacconaster caballi]